MTLDLADMFFKWRIQWHDMSQWRIQWRDVLGNTFSEIYAPENLVDNDSATPLSFGDIW